MDTINMFDDKAIYTYFIPDSKDEKTIEEDNFAKTCDYLGITPKVHDSGSMKLPFLSVEQYAIHNSLAGPIKNLNVKFPEGIKIRVYETSVRDYTKIYAKNHIFKNEYKSSKEINNYVDGVIEQYEGKIEEICKAIVEERIKINQENNKSFSRTKIENDTKSMKPKAIIEQSHLVDLKPEDSKLSNIFSVMLDTNKVQNINKQTDYNETRRFTRHLNMHNSITIINMRDNTNFDNSKHKLSTKTPDFDRSFR